MTSGGCCLGELNTVDFVYSFTSSPSSESARLTVEHGAAPALVNESARPWQGRKIHTFHITSAGRPWLRRQSQSMTPVNKYLPGKYNARLSFYYYRS